MTIQISTSSEIIIDGKSSGLKISQDAAGTIVYTPESSATQYAAHKMPHARYSTAHDAPLSGAVGRKQLEEDIRNLLATRLIHD